MPDFEYIFEDPVGRFMTFADQLDLAGRAIRFHSTSVVSQINWKFHHSYMRKSFSTLRRANLREYLHQLYPSSIDTAPPTDPAVEFASSAALDLGNIAFDIQDSFGDQEEGGVVIRVRRR